ncbi:uncharacterized protein DUF2752 [Gillisia mitskevichiae]|uniref:Uncharacterized protein DUF2752 n=1 Tax=Gillisia mitskevichiae TaxID=270921 RepID=A0A495NZW5_9FLAO|nr:DUF2752 domain-containing protein [Gillisia mitskevichiae]RKS42698.1 uncharacterized protein DUF2752 [Gillisia mitskevichiae]
MEELLLPCLNKQLFGLECYGCGGQRSVLLLLKGDFHAAFIMFPAIYPILILLGFVIFNLFYKFQKDYLIKITLILITAFVLAVSYLFKMYYFFN